ncbi:MAG: ParB/RepB/Spo0J family partition protein [Chloroflexi bacterium]|nr:ParB/RepB/Spo0J family partition protein [Chloroflexota bacterium]
MQQRRKGGLGRGLEALIPGEATGGAQEVDIDAIAPNPSQPRAAIAPDQLVDLAESVRQHGILQPLLVTRRPPGEPGSPYLLVAGERRWRAARAAGLSAVPVVVRETAPQAMLELALVENLQRQDLNPLEAADAFAHLVDDFGLTHEQIARRVGKSRVSVTNILRLRDLPGAIQAAIVAGEITEGHGRALLGLPDVADRLAAFELVRGRDLTVRQTEDLVRRWGHAAPAQPAAAPPTPPDADQRHVEDQLRAALGTRVDVARRPRGQGGRLVIHFYSDEEFDHLYHRLIGPDE